MDNDYLVDALRRLCEKLAPGDMKSARHQIAARSGLSEQYLYQLLSGKSKTGGKNRSVGKKARDAITHAYPDWFDTHASGKARHGDQEFILRVEQEIARYEVPDQIKRAIITPIKDCPPRDSSASGDDRKNAA